MDEQLKNKRVAILAANGYEQSELTEPLKRLQKEGAKVDIVSIEKEKIKGWQNGKWGEERKVDVHIGQANATDYDGLVLPGGQMNPDYLRNNGQAVQFVRSFFEQHKPVAAICHGPWMLVEADVVRGRKVTSYSSIKTDLRNAGANWVDQEVVVDKGLVTSRNPNDLPAFCDKLVEEIREGKHAEQMA